MHYETLDLADFYENHLYRCNIKLTLILCSKTQRRTTVVRNALCKGSSNNYVKASRRFLAYDKRPIPETPQIPTIYKLL